MKNPGKILAEIERESVITSIPEVIFFPYTGEVLHHKIFVWFKKTLLNF